VKNPKKPGEWREAVDAAHGALTLESARQFGLVTGGPEVDVERCEEILHRGAALGYLPGPDAIENFIHALANPSGNGLRT
jgi:hypothetical protein